MSAPAQGEIERALADGELDRARDLAMQAADAGAADPRVLRLAGEGLMVRCRFGEAVMVLRRGLGVAPRDPDLLIALGKCLMELDRRPEALPIFEAAIAADPSRADAHYGAGECAATAGAVDAARAHLEQALALDPAHADAGAALANLLARTGRPAEGRARAETTLSLSPGHPTAMAALAASEIGAGAFTAAEARLRFMLEPEENLSLLLHAACGNLLGDALHGQGRWPEAFDAWRTANGELLYVYAAVAPAAEQLRALIRDVAAWFSGPSRDRWPTTQSFAAGPARGHVFLLGFPRSGTTLLESVLGAHPDVVTLEEKDLLADAAQRFYGRVGGLDTLAKLDPAAASALRNGYWRRAQAAGAKVEGKVFVDKMPLDTVNLPLIARLFPDAKILFARRDPRDVVLSCFRHMFAPNAATYSMLTIEGAAALYDGVMRLAEACRAALPLDLIEVRHERLVSEFDDVMAEVCAFLDLSWSDDLHDFAAHADERTIVTPSAGQVRRGLYQANEGGWASYRDQLSPVMPVLAPWAAKYGYA
jgi:tetratricopeptide (TPR) repeat protein